MGFGGVAGGLLSASIAVMQPRAARSAKRGLGGSGPDAPRRSPPFNIPEIPEGEFYLIDGKRLRVAANQTARGAGTIGSTPDSHVVKAIAAGEKTWELRAAHATVTLPGGGGTARLADMGKNDEFVIYEADTAADVRHRLVVRVAQAPRFYRSHGQAVADLREAVMPPSVSSRLGVQPDSIMFTEPWGEEVYQLGVRRLGTFDPHRREGVVALRIQPVAFEPPLPLRPRRPDAFGTQRSRRLRTA